MQPTQDRLVRKETALGTIRELEPPQAHIGLRVLAPFKEVPTDDVIFDFAKPEVTGLAPARAEDAESELAQKDIVYGGTGRAAVIDWSLKDHYSASDVTRYRENLMIRAQLGTNFPTPLTVNSGIGDFRSKIAKDDSLRRRKLDNRIEWLIMQAMALGTITYNDGKVQFFVDFGRPADQQQQAPGGGLWSLTTSDPIADLNDMKLFMRDRYQVNIRRAVCSERILMNVLNSSKFIARSGLAIGGFANPAGGTVVTPSTPLDPNYLIDGWGWQAALAIIQRQTGITFLPPYDSVYRTRTPGTKNWVNHRFFPEDTILFLPSEDDISELDDGMLGFGKTLTSPHPEGNWQPSYYEWEEETKDPWGLNRGNGIKAFPVFPHMELTFTMRVLDLTP